MLLLPWKYAILFSLFHIHPKMFYSYIESKHQKYFPIPIHQAKYPTVLSKAPKFLLLSLIKFYCKKRLEAAAKKRKGVKKWTSVRNENNGYLDARLPKEKKEKKVCNPVSLKVSKFQKRNCSKEQK
jgi:hypothetical protein